jgi:hypothetical protein
MERDISQRQVLAQRDMQERQNKIVAACHLIYEQNYVVDTPQVEALLKEESLVPTKVPSRSQLCETWHSRMSRMHFQKGSVIWALTFSYAHC